MIQNIVGNVAIVSLWQQEYVAKILLLGHCSIELYSKVDGFVVHLDGPW